MAVAASTMAGPVGVRAARLLATAPATPAAAPNSAASTVIGMSRSVHWRAAAAGATSIALISTTPTACRPATTASTSRPVSSRSRRRTGSPSRAAKAGSKLSSLNSFHSSTSTSRAPPPSAAIVATSAASSVAAWPNRKRSRPACEASGRRWIQVSSISPVPKKTESTRPRALSADTREERTIPVTQSAPSHPVAAAPATSAAGALLPVSRNTSAIPGNAAWLTASPSRLWRRNWAKTPRTPAVAPITAAPAATVRSV